MFNSTPDDLDMHVIYDVSHNIAKVGQCVCFCLKWTNDFENNSM